MSDHGRPSPSLPPELAVGIVQVAPMIVVALDRAGRVEYVNPYFERMSGYALDELRGAEWCSLAPPNARTEVRSRLGALFAGGSMAGEVGPVVTRGGEQRDVEWHARLMRAADGAITGLVAVGKDVTEELRARAALRASETSLREAHALAKLGSWDLDLVSGALRWSEQVYRIFEIDEARFGASYEAFLGAIHPDDRELVDRAYRASVASREAYEITHRLRMSDGRIKHVRERGQSFYDIEGKAIRSLGTVQDVTAEVEANEQLHRTSELLRTVVSGAPVVIYALDRQGVFTLSDGIALSRVGLSPGQLVGHSALELYGGEQGFAESVRRALAGEVTRLEGELGGVVFEAFQAPRYDRKGEIIGVVGVAIDSTERRAAEHRVAQQLAEKEVLLREIHHRVKNNLQVVSSLLFLQREITDSPEAHGVLRESRARIVAMALVHEKLYARSSDLGHVELAEYVRDLGRTLFSTYGVDSRRIALEVRGDGVAVSLDDAVPYGLILNELVSNALKHAFPGGRSGCIEVSIDAGPSELTVAVSDDGVGIDPGAAKPRAAALGQRLIERLAEQLGGTLRSSGPPGTRVELRVPWPA